MGYLIQQYYFQQLKAIGRSMAFLVDIHLNGNRYTCKRPRICAIGNAGIDFLRGSQGFFWQTLDYGINFGFTSFSLSSDCDVTSVAVKFLLTTPCAISTAFIRHNSCIKYYLCLSAIVLRKIDLKCTENIPVCCFVVPTSIFTFLTILFPLTLHHENAPIQ